MQFDEGNIAPVDFFTESTYKDAKGETRPCYRITRKGCEFIAHKLTGTKGTIFTAQYINRFHEMQDILSNKQTELIKKKELLTNRIIRSIGEVNEALRDTEDPNLLTWIFQDIALLSGSIANIERLKREEKI